MEKLSESQFNELLAACAGGCESSWRDLFRHVYPLARWVASFHLSDDRADDIAQETMVALCAAVKDGKVRNVPGYVRTVAHNKCVDYLRKKNPLDHRPNREQEGELIQIAAPSKIPLELAEEDAMTALRQYLREMVSYDALEIQEGGTASSEYVRVTFGDVTEEERARVRSDLLKYFHLDTLAMIKIIQALKKLVGYNPGNNLFRRQKENL